MIEHLSSSSACNISSPSCILVTSSVLLTEKWTTNDAIDDSASSKPYQWILILNQVSYFSRCLPVRLKIDCLLYFTAGHLFIVSSLTWCLIDCVTDITGGEKSWASFSYCYSTISLQCLLDVTLNPNSQTCVCRCLDLWLPEAPSSGIRSLRGIPGEMEGAPSKFVPLFQWKVFK